MQLGYLYARHALRIDLFLATPSYCRIRLATIGRYRKVGYSIRSVLRQFIYVRSKTMNIALLNYHIFLGFLRDLSSMPHPLDSCSIIRATLLVCRRPPILSSVVIPHWRNDLAFLLLFIERFHRDLNRHTRRYGVQ